MDLVYGTSGVVLGIFLTEFFRRLNRIEKFNNQVFNRRLEEYIELHNLPVNQYSLAMDMLENVEMLDKKTKSKLISDVFNPIVTFNDIKSFFYQKN